LTERARVARDALTGAILGTLCAVAAHLLGVQQLLRQPDLSLYVPTAIVGAILGVTRLRSLLWFLGGTLALLCILVAYTPLAAHNARDFVRRDRMPGNVDAVAVLSAGFTSDGLMRSETLDRLLSGIALAQRGVTPNVMVSRESKLTSAGTVTDSADLQNLVSLLASRTNIVFVDSIRTTRTEALRMRAIAKQNGWNTVAVVTSPMHSSRACATFEAVGFKVVCAPATLRQSGLDPRSTPEDRLRAFRSWLYERFATDEYRRRGWIR